MSHLDEIHARATIEANAMPYHRVFRRRKFRDWLRRWLT